MRSIGKILCALDMSGQSALVAEYATTVAKAFNAEITIVYVTPVLTQFLGLNVAANSITRMTQELSADAGQSLQAFIEKHFPGVPVTPVVISGHPAEEIVALADKLDVDVIIMGTRGHQGLNRVLFGSVAEGVVKSANMPVITVRSPEGTEKSGAAAGA